jgi:hypothetical protein
MSKWQSARLFFTCVCVFIFTVGQAIGAQRTTKEEASPAIAGKAMRPFSKRPQQVTSKLEPSTGPQRAAKAVQKPTKQIPSTRLTPMPSKGRLQVKVRKKSIPKAVVQPRTDLIHYGMLEDSQRYDPRPHTDSAVRSPQTPELTHDHFQELDRNQDGMIDPVERAFGRIDMDRDLHTRTLH